VRLWARFFYLGMVSTGWLLWAISLWFYNPCGSWPLFQLLKPIHSLYGSLDGGSARHTATAQTQNKCRQISMTLVGFEATIPAFERATGIGCSCRHGDEILSSIKSEEYLVKLNDIYLTAVTVCTTSFNVKIPHFTQRVSLCFLYDSSNIQYVFS
jgi:hypothetical protein